MDASFFKNQVVAITGGSRGIGFETAKAFLAKKATVSFCSGNKENVEKARRQLAKIGPVLAVVSDVSLFKSVSNFVKETIDRLGKIDILLNNAGVAWEGEFADQDEESINQIIDTNIKGVMYTTKAVLPSMIKNKNGVIINVSSGAGKSGIPGLSAYCASKFAVVGFTESLAGEVEEHGVSVFAICPGQVATNMTAEIAGFKTGLPPERIADKILELAGDDPPVRSGECLEVYS